MFKKIPFYKATFNDQDPNMGVYAIALVDHPAIEEKWVTFADNQKLFKLQREEKRIIVIESQIIDKSRGNEVNKLLGDLPDGAWWVSLKIDNEEIWTDFVKTGIFTGLSIEGIFNYLPENSELKEIEMFIKGISEILLRK